MDGKQRGIILGYWEKVKLLMSDSPFVSFRKEEKERKL